MNETGSIERPRCGETESGRSGHDDFQQQDDFGNFEANLRFLDATQALQPRPTLLEIGCGKGRLIKHLLDAGHDVRGCEVNLLMLKPASVWPTPDRPGRWHRPPLPDRDVRHRAKLRRLRAHPGL